MISKVSAGDSNRFDMVLSICVEGYLVLAVTKNSHGAKDHYFSNSDPLSLTGPDVVNQFSTCYVNVVECKVGSEETVNMTGKYLEDFKKGRSIRLTLSGPVFVSISSLIAIFVALVDCHPSLVVSESE